MECGSEAAVKLRDRHCFKRDSFAEAIAGFKYEHVIHEIKIDLQHERAVRHGRGCDAANGGVERHVPRVIDGRGEGQACFADDLHP